MSFKKHIIYPIILISSLAIYSCGGSKKITKEDSATILQPKPIDAVNYIKLGINYRTFVGKAGFSVPVDGKEQKLTLNLKMNKQKNIWGLASAMGGIIEAARGYITPDSLKATLPLDKSAYSLSFVEGTKLLGANVDFNTLQNLLIGNPLITDTNNTDVKEERNEVIVTQTQKDVTIKVIFDKQSQTIKEQSVFNKANNSSIVISQSDYKPLADKQPFAFKRAIAITQNSQTNHITLDFTKAEIDVPAEVNFRIPDNYTIKSIK